MRNSMPGKSLAAPAHEPRFTDLKRRRFLFTLGAGGASAAVAVASALPGTVAAQIAAAATDDGECGVSRHRACARLLPHCTNLAQEGEGSCC